MFITYWLIDSKGEMLSDADSIDVIGDNYISPPATITFPHSTVPLFMLLS